MATDYKNETWLGRVIGGLQVIQKYSPKAMMGAEHDVIYVYQCDEADRDMTPEDRALMDKYGWFVNDPPVEQPDDEPSTFHEDNVGCGWRKFV